METEPHPEGVDAATARDQQPLAGAPRAQQCQAEQAGDPRRGDGHGAAGELNAPKASESERLAASVHIPTNPGAPSRAPSRQGRGPPPTTMTCNQSPTHEFMRAQASGIRKDGGPGANPDAE
jgi:hypothetical protein